MCSLLVWFKLAITNHRRTVVTWFAPMGKKACMRTLIVIYLLAKNTGGIKCQTDWPAPLKQQISTIQEHVHRCIH